MKFKRHKLFFALTLLALLTSACADKKAVPVVAVKASETYDGLKMVFPTEQPSASTPLPDPSPTPSLEPVIVEKTKRAKIAAVGDLMVHTWQMTDAFNKETGEYDFSNDFEMIKKYLDMVDFRVANLETVFAGADIGYSDFPMFNTPDSFGLAIKEAGFDLVTTANNHSMDKKAHGVLRTLDVLDELEIAHVGTYRSWEERENYYIKDINGIHVAFLSYTYGTNGLPVPSGMEYLVNIMDRNLIANDLKEVKKLNPDLIVVMPHMGNEYELKPKQVFKDWINFMIDNGADIVLASHPHVLQPMELRKHIDSDGTSREVLIVYSLGNFISSQRTEPRDAGVIINIEFSKTGSKQTMIDKVEFIPTWVQFRNQAGHNFVRVLGVADAIWDYENGIENQLRKNDIARLKRVHNEAMLNYFEKEVPLSEMKSIYTFYERPKEF